ncbi:MAG: CCA tRNA nucleotidyltransferase, partial [Paracoccaceae bacterium]
MKITGDWISQAACQSVCALLNRHGFAAYFVGGCVRNDLLGAPISDLDISTDARPEIVMDLAQAAGIRAVATGIDHGTVTLVIDGRPFEITTFRNDVETDGRHAKVRFSTNIADDAARRDFTMNALYADAAGNIIDPLGGLGDLRARHLRFVGIPQDRIREDYLRILRFFRFTAYYGDPDLGFDADALDAIARNLDGLPKLSRERVGSEMTKLLSALDPAPAVAAMRACGVLTALLDGADDR